MASKRSRKRFESSNILELGYREASWGGGGGGGGGGGRAPEHACFLGQWVLHGAKKDCLCHANAIMPHPLQPEM